jgi:hypothetical protein
MSSVYKQTLDIMAAQVKTLADAISPLLVTEKTVPLRKLDWADLKNFAGICLSYDEDAIQQAPDSTNERDVWGYPVYVFQIYPPRPHWDERQEFTHDLKQAIRRYYNFKRRMSAVVDTGTNELQCRLVERTPSPPANIGLEVHSQTVVCWFIEPRSA